MKDHRALALASVSLISIAAPAFAQTAAPAPAAAATNAPAAQIGEVIVQARRRDERLQDVPLVVNAVTNKQLDQLNIRDMKDIAPIVPGLTLTNNANGIGSVATLRGVNFDVNSSGNNGTVEFYLNDEPITSDVVLQSMYDIGQIEVLRGPQGTLRGRASPSGSITVTTQRPDLYSFGGYASANVNDIGGQNLQGAVNLPLIQDKLAIRFAGLLDDNEANRVHSINDHTDKPLARTESGRVSLRFKPIDNLDIDASYQHFVSNTQVFDQVESANLADPTQAASPTPLTANDRSSVEYSPRRFRHQYDIYNLRAQWEFAGLRLNYVGAFNDERTTSADPNDIGAYYSGFGGSGSTANNPYATGFSTVPNLYNAAQFTDSYAHQYSHEIRLSSVERVFGVADFVVGGLINHETSPFNLFVEQPIFVGAATPNTFWPRVAPFITPASPLYGLTFVTPASGFLIANSKQENSRSLESSIFGNVTVHLGEATEISGGLRYIDYRAKSQLYSQADFPVLGGAPGPVTLFANQPDHPYSPVIYSFSVKHRFNDSLMVYASTGSSWRASAETNHLIANRDAFPWGVEQSAYYINPETSKSYEVGIKSDLLDKKLRLNLTYYHQDYSNFFYMSPNVVVAQRTAIPTGGSTTGPNAGDTYQLGPISPGLAAGVPVSVNGVESDFSYRIMPRWNVSGSLSYSVSNIQNGKVPCTNEAAYAAAQASANPGAAYVAAIGGQQVAICSTNSRAGVSPPFVGSFQSDYTQTLTNRVDGFVRGQLTIYGSSQGDPTNPYDNTGAYASLNLFGGVRDPNGVWELTAYVKNAFDTQKVLSRDFNPETTAAVVIGGNGTLVSSYRGITTTAPQEVGLNLRIAFGSK